MNSLNSKLKSYFEIEIQKDRINILERAGHGKTEQIIALLKCYGLDLMVNVNAPCG